MDTLKQFGTTDWDRERIEYVHKHSNSLVCTCSDEAVRDSVWAGSLVRVNTFKCLTHVGYGERELTVLMPRRRHCLFLEADEEGVLLVWEQGIGIHDVAGFPFIIHDSLESLPHTFCV
jgi:hypothetical protein